MKPSDSHIKQAILHPEEEVRLTAVEYFTGTYSRDESVMPLVIEAVKKYGFDNTFTILRHADDLPQSPESLNWLVEELQREFNVADVREDNYRFALAIILLEADPELLVHRHKEIVSIASFPDELREPFKQRLRWHFQDWDTLWQEFEQLGTKTKSRGKLSRIDVRQFDWLVRALSTHREEAGRIVHLLCRYHAGRSRSLMEWLEPQVVRLAGYMKLEAAIPMLLSLLREGDEAVIDEIGPALGRIGGPAVIAAVEDEWWDGDFDEKSVTLEALGHICSEQSLQKCLEFFEEEGEFEVHVEICHTLLSHLDSQAIQPVRQFVMGDDDDLEPDQWDIRWKLVAVATLLGERFAEYDKWHEDALASNYGREPHEPVRLADAFR